MPLSVLCPASIPPASPVAESQTAASWAKRYMLGLIQSVAAFVLMPTCASSIRLKY